MLHISYVLNGNHLPGFVLDILYSPLFCEVGSTAFFLYMLHKKFWYVLQDTKLRARNQTLVCPGTKVMQFMLFFTV